MPLFLTSPLLAAHGVVHGFSVRTGGVSAAPFDALNLGPSTGDDPAQVSENTGRFAAAVGLSAARLATAHQVHGDRVVHAAAADDGFELRAGRRGPALDPIVEADAVVAAPGVAAGVRTADCVPILLFDPISGAAAAVHAGWRGTAAHVVRRAVEALESEWGARPATLRAAIGPAIGPCCYEVAPDLADRFAADPAFGADVVRPGAGGPRLDLVRANARLLAAAGLPERHVDASAARCTACDSALFYSHRRDRGRTGRHLSVVLAGRG